MHISLIDFCDIVKKLERTNAEKALAILWYYDRQQPDVVMTSGELAKVLIDYHVGTPNPTHLAAAIRKTKYANEKKTGFSLKPGSRKIIHDWLPASIDGMQPAMDHSAGYLPEAVWIDTRGYIESVCKQLNGCFRAAYYDAASILLRRLIETLILEAYEHLGRQNEIKDGDGNYFMLKHLVERANGKDSHAGLDLGRDAKKTLEDVKALGDKSAHNRRFVAHASDLTNIQGHVRTTVQELIQIANLKRSASKKL
jgi:hypothetical protein